MSFGNSAGDVIAILQLVERVATEIRNYRNAPQHFQLLQVELDLARSTVHHVLQLQPEDAGEVVCLERIRAIAMSCQRPLQAFIDKMRTKETGLGHFRTTRSLSAVGIRLHWSLISRNDVEDLRKILLSQMLAMSVLLGSLQWKSLHRIAPSIEGQLTSLSNQSTSLASEVALLRSTALETPTVLADLTDLLRLKADEQAESLQFINQKLNFAEKGMKALTLSVGDLGRRIAGLMTLLLGVQKLVKILLQCSGEILNQIVRNARLLLEVRQQMQKALRSIDAIPLHLSLPVIRLDDALGEAWALPFQACTEWNEFTTLLKTVVFGSNRPGATRVAMNQFVIISAKSNSRISPGTWAQAIKAGTHIQQAMVVPEQQSMARYCPHIGCGGILKAKTGGSLEKICPKCGVSSRTEIQTSQMLHLPEDTSGRSIRNAVEDFFRYYMAPAPIPSVLRFPEEDLTKFRRIYTYHDLKPIELIEEAIQLINENPEDPRANQFAGWYQLTVEDDPDAAIPFLIKAVEHDNLGDGQSFCLLGRAYSQARRYDQKFCLKLAREMYQDAIYLNGRCPSYWMSLAVLYFRQGQLIDCLDALIKSMRLNCLLWQLFYNVGILADQINTQPPTAGYFALCLELNPDCEYAIHRVNGGAIAPDAEMVDMPLLLAAQSASGPHSGLLEIFLRLSKSESDVVTPDSIMEGISRVTSLVGDMRRFEGHTVEGNAATWY